MPGSRSRKNQRTGGQVGADALKTAPEQRGEGSGTRGRPFPPGISGNPGGRPKGLAERVRANTADGDELVDAMLKIARGEKFTVTTTTMDGRVLDVERRPSIRERMEAIAWLSDRGWGKPIQEVEVTPGRAFVVLHRALRPGQDPLAQAEDGEVTMAVARRSIQ